MGFAEAASDDGSLTGRGKPFLRGAVCGLMTTAGGIGHTLPYLIPNFRTATAIAVMIVAIELLLISWIRNRYMDTPFLRAAFQVIVGGALVFLVGIWIGSLKRPQSAGSLSSLEGGSEANNSSVASQNLADAPWQRNAGGGT